MMRSIARGRLSCSKSTTPASSSVVSKPVLRTLTMTATPTHFQIGPENTGLWHTRQTANAAKTVSSLLQKDLESHHVFFNDGGFHNHISHHLLSLYGTGASSADLQKAYDDNKGYQRPAGAPHGEEGEQQATEGRSSISVSNDDGTRKNENGNGHGNGNGNGGQDDWYADTGSALLGRQSYYADFLRFFQREMAVDGNSWRTVVTSRLLAGTPAADDLLVRLFAGFLHPLIQLQYGLEWEQPAAVAQGLAQACVHQVKKNGLGDFLLRSEKAAAASIESASSSSAATTILSLFEAVAASPQLSTAAHFDDGNKLDGVLTRAADALINIAARVRVLPTEADVAARTAEMAETCVFVAAAAALHPHKQPKFDFFLIHHVTSIPFFVALNQSDWVPAATKARLLEWKIRMDLAQYAARACPPLGHRLDALHAYGRQPTQATQESNSAVPDSISRAAAAAAARLFNINDDGHAIKLVLGTGLAEEIVRPFADAPWRILRDQALWENIYRLEVDSVLEPSIKWVRSAGFDEAWEEVADLP